MNLCFFEPLASDGSRNGNNRITTLALWGLVFVMLFTLTGLLSTPWGEQLDDDGLSFLEDLSTTCDAEYSLPKLCVSARQLGLVALIPVLEYLQTHVGEKRPADATIALNNSFRAHARSLVTALFFSAVFLLFAAPSPDGGNYMTRVFGFDLDLPGFTTSKFLIHGGFLSYA